MGCATSKPPAEGNVMRIGDEDRPALVGAPSAPAPAPPNKEPMPFSPGPAAHGTPPPMKSEPAPAPSASLLSTAAPRSDVPRGSESASESTSERANANAYAKLHLTSAPSNSLGRYVIHFLMVGQRGIYGK